MKNIKYILVFVFLFLQGCSTNLPFSMNLVQVEKNSVLLKINSCSLLLPITPIATTSNFGKISIDRVFYQDEFNHILVHEKGRLDDKFVFLVGLNSLIYAGFELKDYKTYDIGAFHTYFEGVSKNQTPIYIIASGIGIFETFETFYSDDENTIKNIANCIKTGDSSYHEKNLQTITKQDYKQNTKSFIRSEWGPSIFFKHDIITSKNDNNYWFD